MKDEFLFAYGTLRQQAEGEIPRWLTRYADLVGEATYQGKLYRIADYPGVVPSEDPAHLVWGELYRLRDAGLLLSRLDRYEECGPGFPQPTEYVREVRQVQLRNGPVIPAWVYLYNRPTDCLQPIPSSPILTTQ